MTIQERACETVDLLRAGLPLASDPADYLRGLLLAALIGEVEDCARIADGVWKAYEGAALGADAERMASARARAVCEFIHDSILARRTRR